MDSKDIISAAFHAEKLKRLKRTGWITTGVPDSFQESIADHTSGTAFITILLGNALVQEGVEINIERATTLAVIHDISEAITSDIPKSVSNLDSDFNELKESIEMKAFLSFFDDTAEPEYLIGLLKEFQEHKTAESILVRAADKIDMYIHAITMERAGVPAKQFNCFFDTIDIFISQYSFLEVVAEIGKILKKMHEQHLK